MEESGERKGEKDGKWKEENNSKNSGWFSIKKTLKGKTEVRKSFSETTTVTKERKMMLAWIKAVAIEMNLKEIMELKQIALDTDKMWRLKEREECSWFGQLNR